MPAESGTPGVDGASGGRRQGKRGGTGVGGGAQAKLAESGGDEGRRWEAMKFSGGRQGRLVTDSLRVAVARSSAAEKVARFEECARNLEAEKAKMEVFRRELPINVHLIGDVIEWLRDEVEHHRRPTPELLVSASSPSPAPTVKRKVEGIKAEADTSDKRSWTSSAQLWTCRSRSSTNTSNGDSVRKQVQKVDA